VDKEQSCEWLKFGDMKGKSQRTVVAALILAFSTDYFQKNSEGVIVSKCQPTM